MRTFARYSLLLLLSIVPPGSPLAEPTAVGPASPAGGEARAGAGDGVVARKHVESILGRAVRTREGDAGRIIDVLVDGSGQVQAAAIELGGFLGIGTRKVAVEWSALRFDIGGKQQPALLEMSRDQLRRAPEFRPDEPLIVRGSAE
jgi:hypothetical protein